VPLDELTGLLARWHAADSRMARVRVMREASSTLGGLNDVERRELGRALAAQGVGSLARQVEQGSAVWGPSGWEEHAAQELLGLDTDRALDVISELEGALAGTSDPSGPTLPPPPPGGDHHLPAPGEDPALAEWERPWRPEEAGDDRPPDVAEATATEDEDAGLAEHAPAGQEAPADRDTSVGHATTAGQDPSIGEDASAGGQAPAAVTSAEAGTPPVEPVPPAAPAPSSASLAAPVVPPRAAVAGASLAHLRELPAGWRRRRATVQLVRDGELDDVDPRALLHLFDRDGDRTRVAAALVARDLVDGSVLLDELPPAAGRRLARRRARRD
jgi:hypothetical protein